MIKLDKIYQLLFLRLFLFYVYLASVDISTKCGIYKYVVFHIKMLYFDKAILDSPWLE